MKMMLWCLVSGVALATSAYAGDEDEMEHGSPQAGLKMMDTDHDGSVSADEFAAAEKKMFEQMDKDGDGILTVDEMRSAHKAMNARDQTADSGRIPQADSSTHTSDANGKPIKTAGERMMKEFDTDQDGTISAAEHEAGARKMFDRMDKDRNGKLSAAELKAGHERMLSEDQ